MSLEDQIAQIVNPQEFTRLCNAVLIAEYGTDFQVIDGTRSDEGNDGYIISEKRIIAMNCPIKPERKKDSDYIRKIKSDLNKASILKKSGKFLVEKWTFMTPRKLSNRVISIMREEANKLGIAATHQESTYLAITLQKHRHIIKEFPNLSESEMEKKIDQIYSLLKEERKQKISKESEINKEHIYKAKTENQAALERVLKLREGKISEGIKEELRSTYYTSNDHVVKMNALLGILDLYEPYADNAEDMVGLCDEGLLIAQTNTVPSIQAYFLAQKGYFLSFIYSDLDMKTACYIKADNLIGIYTISEEYRKAVLHKLEVLEKQYLQSFNEAMDLATKPYDPPTLALVLISIGNAAAQRAIYLNFLDVADRCARERQLSKRALLSAKDIYVSIEDELGATNALFNLANNIRCFGEEKEALNITVKTIEIASKYNDNHLLQRAKWLKESLESGKIPDYMAGERRE